MTKSIEESVEVVIAKIDAEIARMSEFKNAVLANFGLSRMVRQGPSYRHGSLSRHILLDSILATGEEWTTKEIHESLDREVSRAALNNILSKMVKTKQIVRSARGVYRLAKPPKKGSRPRPEFWNDPSDIVRIIKKGEQP